MEVITTHSNTDFDGLASMIAAQKLYPEAQMVFPGKLSKNVEEFMSLHKDIFNVLKFKHVKSRKVSRIILVDTKNQKRTGNFQELFNDPEVDVHIYDHHPWAEEDLRGSLEMVDILGSTTTLMVELLKKRHLDVTPLEATVMALGIYADTGSLLFTNTTPRDLLAAAFLVDKGANLAVVSEFIDRPFTEEQDRLLKNLLLSAEKKTVHGLKILITTAETDEFIEGLSFLTHSLSNIEKTDAIFTVVKMEDRVHMVARSTLPQIHVADILAPFNGAGHPTAASATIKNTNLKAVIKKLNLIIEEEIKPSLTASDIMSSPVKTVFQKTTIHEARRIMMRYGHSGLPVVEDRRLKGIISLRDIEKAIRHGLGHAPVKGFMHDKVITVSLETPLAIVRQMLITHDIGRVPVIAKDRLVGIISRTDILVTLHGETQRKKNEITWARSAEPLSNNIYEAMQKNLLPSTLAVLQQAGHIARELGFQAFTAGGVVRDLLLGYDNIDVDIVVEGDGIAVAAFLAEQLGARLKIHQRFGTAELLFPDGFSVDVATARVEYYEYPAALPQVESATIRQDLYRRDFSINAMAASIREDDFGQIIDYFGGREDIQQGLIRVLYNLSFIEDPTRILRAVRFEQRYKMKIEPQTLQLLREAVKRKVLHQVSTDRLWDEIKNIMLEPLAGKMFSRLEHLQVWEQIFSGINFWDIQPVIEHLKRSKKVLTDWGFGNYPEPWMPFMIAIFHLSSPVAVEMFCHKYHFSKKQTEKIRQSLDGWRDALAMLENQQHFRTSQLAEKINKLPPEAYPLLHTLLDNEKHKKRFKKLLITLRDTKPSLGGSYIKSLGYKPGPGYRYLLDELWKAKIDGQVKNEDQEKEFIQNRLKKQMGEI